MKRYFLIIILLTFVLNNSYSQLKFSEDKTEANTFGKSKTSDIPAGILVPLIFFSLINPMLVVENKKVYFGLTREVSAGIYPLGRLSFEYSYIFRNYSTSHLRLSYNYDIVTGSGNFMASLISPGAGYFTDTHSSGFFGQLAFGILFAAPLLGNSGGLSPYLRLRDTYVTGSNRHNIFDFSLGMSFIFSY